MPATTEAKVTIKERRKKDQGNTVTVGGISINPFNSVEDAANSLIKNGKITYGFAASINAEVVVKYANDEGVRKIIDSATLNYADGIPIKWLISHRGVANSRIAGCELWEEIMKKCGLEKIPAYLVGGTDEVNRKTCDKLMRVYSVNLVGAVHGFNLDENKLLEDLQKTRPKIVTVALGSPYQEKLIFSLREQYSDALYLGVGGTYDIFSGKLMRAPLFMREFGLEWLYRLMRHPTRIVRYTALVKFLVMWVRGKL